MKNSKNKMAKTQKEKNGKLLLYLLIVIAAVFLISKLDITGMASKETSLKITQTVTAGDSIILGITPGTNGVKQEIDVYKGNVRFCQTCWNVCKSSKCTQKARLDLRIPDSWKTGEYSIRVYDWGKSKSYYKEVSFSVIGYPETGPQEHY